MQYVTNIFSKDFNTTLQVFHGIDEKLALQLIDYSQKDLLIQKFTNDAELFKDLESYRNWYIENNHVFVLINDDAKLLGIVWISNEDPAILSFRIYSEARNLGFAKQFVSSASLYYKENLNLENKNYIHANVHKENEAAGRILLDLDFIKIQESDTTYIMKLDL